MKRRLTAFDRVAQQLIARAVANLHEPAELGAAIAATCMRLELAMAAMVGDGGCRALLERALHLTRKQGLDPELPLALARSGSGGSWIGCIERVGAANTAACAAMLVAHVLTLLASFIGEDLTFRLIRRAFHDFKEAESEGGQKP